MRPTVSEQIESLGRILSDVVLPEVAAPYPATILRGVIAALDGLSAALPHVPAFLAWDAEVTAAVLTTALPLLAEPLAGEVRTALAQAPAAEDWSALEQRQRRLRGLLVKAMPAIADAGTQDEAYRGMIALFRERADRFPFAMSAQPVKKS
jgi:hypothetical protein